MTVLHDTVFLFGVGNTLPDNDVVVIALSIWDAVVGWQPHTLSRADTVAQIALRLREWVDTFERARAA